MMSSTLREPAPSLTQVLLSTLSFSGGILARLLSGNRRAKEFQVRF
uniref:Uncharacterized protein n=1 Tax=mine drainage metagenome TaxID=410659 RepID=E6PYI7_9ZZZZ